VQPGVPRPALCYRVIALVYSQSHVTGALEMPQLIAPPIPHDGVALTPRTYQRALDAKLHADAETKARYTLHLTAP
jgi:hypothetical protein